MAILLLILYVVPPILKVSIIELFSYKSIISLLVFFAVIPAGVLVVQIFLKDYEDGTELLIASKPITRTTMIWSKLFVLIMEIIISSVLASICSSFVNLSYWNFSTTTGNIVWTVFLGTFVNFCLWAALTLVFTVFSKKILIVMVTIGIQAILMLVSMIYYFTQTSPNEYMQKNNISWNHVNLVTKTDKEGLPIECKHFGYMSYNDLPITNNTIIDGEPLKNLNINLNNFASKCWEEGIKHSNYYQTGIPDLENQFIAMYRIYSDETLRHFDWTDLEWSLNNSIFRDWEMKFTGENINELASKNNIVSLNKNKLVLGYLNNLVIEDKNSDKYYSYDLTNDSNGFVNNVERVNWNLSKTSGLTFPIYQLNSQTNLWKEKTFNDLDEFAKYYYSPSEIDNAIKFLNYSKKNLNWHSTFIAYYFSPILQNLVASNNASISEFSTKEKVLENYFAKVFQFQFATYSVMKEYYDNPSKYPWIDLKTLEVMARTLQYSPTDIRFRSIYDISYNSPSDFNSCFNTINPTPLKLITLSCPLSLNNAELLPTLFVANVENQYNPIALVLGWMSVALVMVIFSIAMYSKMDIR